MLPMMRRGYVKDVLRLANDPRYPKMAQAVRNWAGSAQSDVYGGELKPTELDARVVEYGGRGEQAPEWFREKWGQDIWRDTSQGEGPMQQPTKGVPHSVRVLAQELRGDARAIAAPALLVMGTFVG
jgi:hypothetical protein